VTTKKPLRADAQRNRQTVLEVAEAVFAAEGLTVPIDEIARRAGLGIGTLYRHFPTKEALFAAIVVSRLDRALADARALFNADDPGDAFFRFLVRLVEEGAAKKDFVDALAAGGVDVGHELGERKKDLRRAMGKLLERAQKAGDVRRDVAIADVLALVSGAFVAIEHRGGDARTRAQLLAVVCDGLRPPRRSLD